MNAKSLKNSNAKAGARKTMLLTWSDRGVSGRVPSYINARTPRDSGPVMRLVRQEESKDRYDAALVLSIPSGAERSTALLNDLKPFVKHVELRVVDVDDPSDHAQLFHGLAGIAQDLKCFYPIEEWDFDVLLSAGTPQAQTIWVVMIQAGILHARMLQVIPSAFVPHPHPKAIREVHFDIEGFPEIRALRDEVQRLRTAVKLKAGNIIGQSEPVKEMLARIARVAASDAPVVIVGETGTGKELVAKAIHENSSRAKGPFIAENCGAFAEGVLASELFGHEAGAFTGAGKRRRGLFEQAHGGTLFLDEVGEMSLRVQAHLLRVLQEGSLRPVGGESQVRVDVRVIAATHRNLADMVSQETFRKDLYYRLKGAWLEAPPLRKRREDLFLLIDHFLAETNSQSLRLTNKAKQALGRYHWPGNVRELRSEVTRWSVFCDRRVDLKDLAPEIIAAFQGEDVSAPGQLETVSPGIRPLAEIVASVEKTAIAEALDFHGGNLSRTARALNIDRNTLKRKIGIYGLRVG